VYICFRYYKRVVTVRELQSNARAEDETSRFDPRDEMVCLDGNCFNRSPRPSPRRLYVRNVPGRENRNCNVFEVNLPVVFEVCTFSSFQFLAVSTLSYLCIVSLDT